MQEKLARNELGIFPSSIASCTIHRYLAILKATTGPDGLSARILKMAAAAIAGGLTKLFNVSLTEGDFPMEWKKANVYPVFKSGNPCLRTNYRPISVLSVIAKVFETIVHQQVTSYFISNDLFTKAQSGFRSGHSTQDVLLRVTEDWKLALDADDLVGIMFIDLSKAFDSIDHSLLIAKLFAYGFDGISLRWFTNYLSNRRQRVVLDHVYSDWAAVMRGVPQGSVLGPLLFIIYMNDLPAVIQHSHMNLFADDIALYVIHSDPCTVQTYLNHDLSLIFQWVTSNGFKVNVSKSQLLLLARRHRRNELSSIQIFLAGNLIQPKSCVKYLGILVDSDLAWTEHIHSLRKKCLAVLSVIRRISIYMPTTLLKTLYKAFVLPCLTYCCCVWHFCSGTVSDHLQRVQNYAMRVVLKKPPRTSSCTCLRSLGWQTLYQHRCLLLLCQVKRCLLKISPSYLTSLFMTNEQFGYTSTRGRDKIHMLRPRTEFGRHTFSFRGAQLYNILPSTARQIKTLPAFKHFCVSHGLPVT